MSADYHAKMSQSLFNYYNNLVAIKDNDNTNTSPNKSYSTSETTVPIFNNNTHEQPQPQQTQPQNFQLNQPGSLLTPNIQEYKSRGFFEDEDEDDEFGYFSSRAAMSVPSSRIDTTTNTFDQQLQQFVLKPEQTIYFNNQSQGGQNYQVPPPQMSTQEQPNIQQPQQQHQDIQYNQHVHQPLLQQQHMQRAPVLQTQAQQPQSYMGNNNVMVPPARPPPQRQNTAPVYSLSVKNLQQQQQQQQQQQLQQQNASNLRYISPPTGYFHQRGESMSHDTRPKIKKGPRPKKKPGFHLKLDGLRKVSGPTITSSQSDSGTDYWNRTPSGYSKLNLSFAPALGTEQGQDLRISEQDLELNDNNFSIPSFNLTPSVDPPRNGTSGYFELTNQNTNINNANANNHNNNLTPGINILGATAGGFFSPAINENAVNYFNQTFEEYLQDAEKISSTNENTNTNDILGASTNEFQQDTLDTNFTDLNLPESQSLFAPLNFDNSLSNEFLSPDNETIDSQNRSFNNEISTPQYYNNSTSGGDEDDQEQVSVQAQCMGQTPNHSDSRLALPVLQRSISNQSAHSAISLGSELTRSTSTNPNIAATPPATVNNIAPTTKLSKKRVSKGAVCTVCDKYISRDIARHMRIHDDVGRFQCVYPKAMCNHRTQNFNRPYDYKKHLLHLHFIFDDPKGKTANTLTDKLPIHGTCSACGQRFIASDWLDSHVLTKDPKSKCRYINQGTN